MEEFTSKEDWLAAVEAAGAEVSSWGYGSADAFKDGYLIGTWKSLFNLDVSHNTPKGWVKV